MFFHAYTFYSYLIFNANPMISQVIEGHERFHFQGLLNLSELLIMFLGTILSFKFDLLIICMYYLEHFFVFEINYIFFKKIRSLLKTYFRSKNHSIWNITIFVMNIFKSNSVDLLVYPATTLYMEYYYLCYEYILE